MYDSLFHACAIIRYMIRQGLHEVNTRCSIPKWNVVILVEYVKKFWQLDVNTHALARVNFLLCLHELNNSSLELSVASLGLYRMKYFSRRQSLQTPVTGLKLLAFPRMLQLRAYWILFSFKYQIYLLNIVLFLFLLFLKSLLCP